MIETTNLERLAKENALYALQIDILGSKNLTQSERDCFLHYISNYMENVDK